MNQDIDLIVVAVYSISVVWVLYQAVESLDEQTTISFEKKSFEDQLAVKAINDKALKEIVDINFKFDDRYLFSAQPKTLSITVNNKSESVSIKVDWDRCSLLDYENRSHRVIRLPADKRVNLSDRQVFSIVPPGGSLKETITVEDLLQRSDGEALEPKGPLINIEQLAKAAENKKTPQKIKDLYANFIAEKAPLPFTLRIALRLFDWAGRDNDEYLRSVDCSFNVYKVPWIDYLPFNPKKS